MSADLVVTGRGVVCAAGIGTAAMTAALADGARPAPDVTALYSDAMPQPTGYALVDFDVRALLGRKGTTFLDRATGLALVAFGEALAEAGLVIDDESRTRVGIALGTTVGSLRSSADYSLETLVADRPYLVNPALFPNTVMNCASGQAAIRYGLRGVNSTVATGRVGFLGALGYAANVLRRGYASAMLVGAVEEFTPHTAWTHHRLRRPGQPGEAAAVFVLEPRANAVRAGRRVLAELAAIEEGYHPGDDPAERGALLAGCLSGVLAEAGAEPGQVQFAATTEAWNADDELIGRAAVAALPSARPVRVRDALGDCGAAAGALQFAALLDAGGRGTGVLAGWSPEGAFGAAVLRGRDRAEVA
ncbi:beta-ketoacyl synthase [Solihabitans fulvus]|uniref:Beta-ketoacyl synthase n=1 Tax=Solihabitans fulvus TaxID=1892852 RepID=A0A5B2XPX2_9PSEU|nr:beta-ketoacyl synthase N-terminal-like domain-containing protein [Solihabitans fulvus]KAA2265787.1 beta-ketoacyl synthase [Solihabitans fulvus]